MAAFPPLHPNDPMYITPIRMNGFVYAGIYTEKSVKKETKEEKKQRIAKEKMMASRKVYDRKTRSINEIKQHCKPNHRINHIFGRLK